MRAILSWLFIFPSAMMSLSSWRLCEETKRVADQLSEQNFRFVSIDFD
jgi:hypothetical protein